MKQVRYNSGALYFLAMVWRREARNRWSFMNGDGVNI